MRLMFIFFYTNILFVIMVYEYVKKSFFLEVDFTMLIFIMRLQIYPILFFDNKYLLFEHIKIKVFSILKVNFNPELFCLIYNF